MDFIIGLVGVFGIGVLIFKLLGKQPELTEIQKQNIQVREAEQGNIELAKRLESKIKESYSLDEADTMIACKAFIGMSEVQFDQVLELQWYLGKGDYKNPYPHREHVLMKTKSKVIRRKRRTRASGEQEFVFENDSLVKITSR